MNFRGMRARSMEQEKGTKKRFFLSRAYVSVSGFFHYNFSPTYTYYLHYKPKYIEKVQCIAHWQVETLSPYAPNLFLLFPSTLPLWLRKQKSQCEEEKHTTDEVGPDTPSFSPSLPYPILFHRLPSTVQSTQHPPPCDQ